MTEENKAVETQQEENQNSKVIAVAKKTMIGDLRDCVLNNVLKDKKLTGKSWSDMSEAEQKSVVSDIVCAVEATVERAIDIIHSDGQKHIKAVLKQVTVKDGYKAVFECSANNELRHELVDAQGETILVVLTGSDKYLGEREKVKYDKDEPELLDAAEDNNQEKESANEETTPHDPETGEIDQLEKEADELT